MKRLFTLTLLMLGLTSALVAQTTEPSGSQPESGKTYYLYNVEKGQYLSAGSDNTLTLGSPYLEVTLNQPTTTTSSDADFYTIEANGKKVLAALWEAPILGDNKQGYYDQWQISAVSGKTNVYTLACRNRESGSLMYMYWIIANDRLSTVFLKVWTSFVNGQWKLVASDDLKDNVTLRETAESYTVPTLSYNKADVKLVRTFTLNSWNSFCVPFDIDNAQLKSQFGSDVQVAEFSSLSATSVNFKSVTAVEAGKPYLIKPTKEAQNTLDNSTEKYYTFTDVSDFASSPTQLSNTYTEDNTVYGITFTGSFCKTTAPSRAFVLRNNKVYHLTSDMAMKGFRAYFQNTTGTSEASSAKVTTWTLDETTDGITSVEDMGSDKFDVFNAAGQKVRQQATSIDDLPSGVYIVNGKKITK